MILKKEDKIRVRKLSNLPQLTDEAMELIGNYLEIEDEYRYGLREMSAKLENLDDYCESHFNHNPIHHIESRIKNYQSIIDKIEKRGYKYNMSDLRKFIYDIAGISVVCNYIEDIHHIIKMLNKQSDLKVMLKKDYISSPKESGYRSIHVVYIVDISINGKTKSVPVEIQFRTIAMDMWASLEHELRYKSKNKFSEEQKRDFKLYSDKLYEIDLAMQKQYELTYKKED